MVMAISDTTSAAEYGSRLSPGRPGMSEPKHSPSRPHFRASVRSRAELGCSPVGFILEERAMLDRRHLLAMLGTTAFAALAPGALRAAAAIKPDDASALLVIDVQNCFLPGGSLAVKEGEQVVPVINKIAKGFANVVMTQAWHTPGHISFASVHAGKQPFETIDLPYGKQVLWPDHCVQGTDGAALSKALSIPPAEHILRKGIPKAVASYSAFLGADGTDGSGTSNFAWWKFGSNFGPCGSSFFTPSFSSALSSERSVSSTPSI